MDIRRLIELGNAAKGSQAQLAQALGTTTSVLAAVKGGRQGLPDYACFMLARILEIEPSLILAASALVTEKREERRQIFYPYVDSASLPLHMVAKSLEDDRAEALRARERRPAQRRARH